MGSWTLFLTPGELAGPWKGFSIWQGSQHWQRIMSRGCTHQLLVLEPDLHQQQPGWGSAPPPLCFPLCLLPPPVTNPEPGPVVCFMDKIIPSRGTARAQLPLRAAGFSCQALSSTVPLGASEVSCSQKGHVGTSQRQRVILELHQDFRAAAGTLWSWFQCGKSEFPYGNEDLTRPASPKGSLKVFYYFPSQTPLFLPEPNFIPSCWNSIKCQQPA